MNDLVECLRFWRQLALAVVTMNCCYHSNLRQHLTQARTLLWQQQAFANTKKANSSHDDIEMRLDTPKFEQPQYITVCHMLYGIQYYFVLFMTTSLIMFKGCLHRVVSLAGHFGSDLDLRLQNFGL